MMKQLLSYSSRASSYDSSNDPLYSRWMVPIVLVIILLIATFFSLSFFLGQSLRLDESQSLWQSARTPVGIVSLVAEDVHVPLYLQLLHAWRVFFGNTVESARAMSLLFYFLSIPALYALGSLVYSRTIGLYAALLLGISPFLNWYGNEIRMYSLFLLLTILNQYFFVSLMRTQKLSTWIGYTITAILGLYTHYFFVCILIGQAVYYFVRPTLFGLHGLRSFSIITGVLGITFLPWVGYVFYLGRIVNQEPLLVRPTTVDLFNAFSQFYFGFQTDAINTIILSLWPLGALLVFFVLRHQFSMQKETEYFLISTIISFGLAFGISLLVEPVFISRYLIFTTPALFLLTASLFMRYTPLSMHIGLVGIMTITLWIQATSLQTPVRESYREAVGYVNTNALPSDIFVVSAPFTLYPVEYYYRGLAPLVTLPHWDQYAFGPIPAYSDAEMETFMTEAAQSYQTVWILLSYNQGYESNIRDYLDRHYHRLFAKEFSHNLTLYQYQFRYDTPLSRNKAPTTTQTLSH